MKAIYRLFLLFFAMTLWGSFALASLDGFNCEQRRIEEGVSYAEVDRCVISSACRSKHFGWSQERSYSLKIRDAQTGRIEVLVEDTNFLVVNEEARKMTRSCFCIGEDFEYVETVASEKCR